jgi:23S rRNA pseudouridine2457 synthase
MSKTRRSSAHSYIIFYKPYGVLCQFTDSTGRRTLSAFGPFPRSVYAAGRLDADSEGLVFLTDDGELKHRLIEPSFGHERTYLVQVERIPSAAAIARLRTGIVLDGRPTKPASVRLLEQEPSVPPRDVPIRIRKAVPTSWLEITLREGRNRQVRRMTAATGHPTLRLIRIRFGPLDIADLSPGQSRVLTKKEIASLLTSLHVPSQIPH